MSTYETDSMNGKESVESTVRAALAVKAVSGLINCRSKLQAKLAYRESVKALAQFKEWLDEVDK